MQLCSHDPIRRHATSKIVRQREIYLILFSIDILMISMTIENEKKRETHVHDAVQDSTKHFYEYRGVVKYARRLSEGILYHLLSVLTHE